MISMENVKNLYKNNDIVMSELLRDKVFDDLTDDEVKELLAWSGDDEDINVDEYLVDRTNRIANKIIKELQEEALMNLIETSNISMRCLILRPIIHKADVVDWDKVNYYLHLPSHDKYDYNLFDSVYSIDDFEELFINSQMAEVDGCIPKFKQTCKQCGHTFTMINNEIQYFINKELSVPKRCKYCRKGKKRSDYAAEAKKLDNLRKENEKNKPDNSTAFSRAFDVAGIEYTKDGE